MIRTIGRALKGFFVANFLYRSESGQRAVLTCAIVAGIGSIFVLLLNVIFSGGLRPLPRVLNLLAFGFFANLILYLVPILWKRHRAARESLEPDRQKRS